MRIYKSQQMSGLNLDAIPAGVFMSEQVQAFVAMVRAEVVHALREINQTHDALRSSVSESINPIDLRTVADTCLLPYRQLTPDLEHKESSEILLRHCHFASFQNLFLLEYNRCIQDACLGYKVSTDYNPVTPGKFMSFVYTFLYDHQQHLTLLTSTSETELILSVYSGMRRAASQIVRVMMITELPKPEPFVPTLQSIDESSCRKDTLDVVSSQEQKVEHSQPEPEPEPEPEHEPQRERQIDLHDIQPSDSVSNVGQSTSIETQMQPFLRTVTLPSVLSSTDQKTA